MTCPASSREFLDAVRASELINPAELAHHFEQSGLPSDPRDAAAALVQAGTLTAYQANQLLQGRQKGFLVGAYKILRPVGKGGAGTVFLAEHTAMKRRVALKLIPAGQITDKLALERFHREARSAAALDHANIVLLYDVGQTPRVHYLAMEFVEGEDLQSMLDREGPPHFADAVNYAYQAAAGLQHAHEKGLVHRDVKPGNLIRSKDGQVKILDMGLARSFSDEADNVTAALGANAEATGTIDYVSPEQALNEPLDQRADLYSLGATLFALIAGYPPFRGTMLQKLAQHQTVDPPRLSDVNPSVPTGLSDVVARMMSKRPTARYQTAREVMAALSPWLASEARKRLGVVASGEKPAAPQAVKVKQEAPEVVQARLVRRKRDDRGGAVRSESSLLDTTAGTMALCGGAAVVLLGAASFLLWLFLRPAPAVVEEEPRPAEPRRPAVVAAPVSPPASPQPAPPPEGAVDPRFVLVSLDPVATASSHRAIFGPQQRLVFSAREREWFSDVPFRMPSPPGASPNNLILLNGSKGEQSSTAPESVVVPVAARAAALHFLGGVAGWGWPIKEGGVDTTGMVAMTVRLRYDDGTEEDHDWRNGVEVADWYRRNDVPGSSFAFVCEFGRQVRYLSVRPKRPEPIKEIEFRKGEIATVAPIVIALTVEK